MGLRQRSRQSTTELMLHESGVAQRAMLAEMRAGATVITDTIQMATANWKHKPEWQISFSLKGSRITMTVLGVGSKLAQSIFMWVDEGTGLHGPKGRAYKIPKVVKKGQKPLHFQTGYQAKTKPIAQVTGKNGERTGPWVSALQVTHPGIEPRKFVETAQANLKPSLDKRINEAIKKAFRRQGLGG